MTEPASAPANRPMASLVAPPVAISPARNSGTAANAMVSPVATANLLRITVDRGTGVASRCTTLPSSISAPSTLVPTISAVSGSTTGSISDLHQVGEHALQRLILGQQLTELDAVLPREPRDLPAERAVVRGLHLQ